MTLSRSRPYQKNDNRFVEAKNFTLVRAYFGDERFDTLAHYRLLARLYDQMWLYYNAFQPVLRLAEKERAEQDGQTYLRRRWDEARTPSTACVPRACWSSRSAPRYWLVATTPTPPVTR